MFKKVVFAAALVAGLATVSVASILLEVGGHDLEIANTIEISGSIDAFDLMSQAKGLPDQTPDNPI